MRDGTPAWLMAGHAGFPQPAALSTLLHAPFVPATPTNIQRLQRLADKIHFPREQIFLEETEQEVEASA